MTAHPSFSLLHYLNNRGVAYGVNGDFQNRVKIGVLGKGGALEGRRKVEMRRL
jgi:hypothetical protein